MLSRRERLAHFVAPSNPAKAIRRPSLSLARAPVALSELWGAIEGTCDVLSVMLGKLESPQDIGNAAAVSRAWRAAVATNDDIWDSLCRSFPLLCLVREETWCVATSKELIMQQHAAQFIMSQAKRDRFTTPKLEVCGPRLQQDYFSVHSLTDDGLTDGDAPAGQPKPDYPIPDGSARATRAQVERNGVLRRIPLDGKICLLSDGDALFPRGTGPQDPPCWETAEISARAAVLGRFGQPFREDSSWFDTLLTKAKDMSGMMHVSEVVARCRPSEFLRGLLNHDVASLTKTAADLQAIADGHELPVTKDAALAALKVCTEVSSRKKQDIPRRPYQTRVCKADRHELNAQHSYEPAALRKPIEHQLLFSDPPLTNLRALETSTIRRDFLLGIEVRSGCGTVLLAEVADLRHLYPGLAANLYYTEKITRWPGPANVPPRVSVFILRKKDGSRLDLVADSTSSDAYQQDDYDSSTVFCDKFGIADTGRYGGLFNLLRLEVSCVNQTQCLTRVSVALEPGDGFSESYDDWVVRSAEWMLHILSSPGFVDRWVAPPRKRRGQAQAGSSLTALVGANDCLRTTVVASKPPQLLSLVLQHLEVKLMVRTGLVCRDWHAALSHPETWSRVLLMHPLLAQIRKQNDLILPSSSTKSLFIQQCKARRAMSAQLVRPPRTDYCLAVEILDDGKLVHSSLADIATAEPKIDLLSEDCESLATVTFTQRETVGLDDDLRLSLSMFRKHDGKRFPLYDDCVCDGDADVLYFCGALPTMFSIYDTSTDLDSVPTVVFDANLNLEPVSDGDDGSATLSSIDIRIDSADFTLPIGSVDGMIQLLECPCFVHLWK